LVCSSSALVLFVLFVLSKQSAMTLTLLGLAAGMGSRFGGPKQLAPLGPNGETILDYAIYDALGAGFGAVALVIRAELRDAFERGVVQRWRSRVPVELVEQHTEPERAKPWGTAHAVLAARDALRGPFAVVNGDDFYGRGTYERLAEFLRSVSDRDAIYSVVGFPLGDTLSEAGGVNRAVLEAASDGTLAHVEEVRGIERVPGDDGVVRDTDGRERVIPRDTPVSMNSWGFTRAALPQIEEGFRAFRDAHARDASAEFLIPGIVEDLVRARRATVRVLAGGGPWFGMTYPEDLPRVSAALGALVARGDYPSPVWG
jgi:hypothetical protein